MNRTANAELDFSAVELSAAWPHRAEFFNSFAHFAPLFTYRLDYDGGAAFDTVKKLNLIKYNLIFDSPEEFMNTDGGAFSGRKTVPGVLCVKTAASESGGAAYGRKLSDLCVELLDKADAAFAADKPAVRLYIDSCAAGPESKTSAEIIDFLDDMSGRGLIDPRRISFCFQAGNVLDLIEVNKSLALKYPGLSRSLHIEPSKGLNKVENAILFYLKFSDAGLKDCTIAPRFDTAAAAADAGDDAGTSCYLDTLEILRSLEFSNIPGVFFISCPTCARCKINVIALAKSIYGRVRYIEKSVKIAVMGCEVNGPGEAAHADIGVAGSLNNAVIFERGRIVERVTPDKIEEKFMERIAGYVK